MGFNAITYALSQQYTDISIEGTGGVLAGKNCTIDSIVAIDGGHRITFKWTADNGNVQTRTLDVMNGEDGVGYTPVSGTVSLLDSDADPTVNIVINEDEKTATFNFGIPRGYDGITFDPVPGEVETLPYGSEATVELVVDEEAKTLKYNFGIPRGKSGGLDVIVSGETLIFQ